MHYTYLFPEPAPESTQLSDNLRYFFIQTLLRLMWRRVRPSNFVRIQKVHGRSSSSRYRNQLKYTNLQVNTGTPSQDCPGNRTTLICFLYTTNGQSNPFLKIYAVAATCFISETAGAPFSVVINSPTGNDNLCARHSATKSVNI